jgi:2-hydroxy-3-keto-5-methylthiopentenyl-1-phosphate phosphatase
MIMGSTEAIKTVLQCDFDGTITQDDQSFLLLDNFAKGNWKQLLSEYREGKISVGDFNTQAFVMVKEDKQTLIDFIRGKVKIRAGFNELLTYCRRNGFQFVIVSNGLDFYIDAILKHIGVNNIKVFAAQAHFGSRGIEVKYVGHDGSHLESQFKDTYIRSFLTDGYRVIYVGNGLSDISPARLAHYIFARDELLAYCKEASLDCTPFVDLNDVVKGLKLLERG